MIHTLKIGGKTRPFVFGFYAMLSCEEEFGLDISAIADGKYTAMEWIKSLPVFVCAGLRQGEYINGVAEPDNYDPNIIRAWMDSDPEVMGAATELCTKGLESLSKTGEEAKDDSTAKKKPSGKMQRVG